MVWENPPSFPELFKVVGEGRKAAAVGVDTEVFRVFFQDRVLQRLADQIIEDGNWEKIFKVFSQVRFTWFQQRFVEQNLDAWVLGPSSDVLEALERISHIFYVHALFPWAIWRSSSSSWYLAVSCPGVHATVNGCFWKNFLRCLRESELGGPCCSYLEIWTLFQQALHMAVGVFTVFFIVFFGLRPFGRWVPAFRRVFFGPLDGQQLLVIEGSRCAVSSWRSVDKYFATSLSRVRNNNNRLRQVCVSVFSRVNTMDESSGRPMAARGAA